MYFKFTSWPHFLDFLVLIVFFLCKFSFSALLQVKVEEEDEEGSVEEEKEEENLEKAFSVARFQDIVVDSASTSGDRMGRNYTEKDFESKQKLACPAHKYSTPTVQLHKEKLFL